MLHLDDARRKAISLLQGRLESAPRGSKAVLIEDLLGKLRLVLWAGSDQAEALKQDIDSVLRKECGRYWTRDIWVAMGGGRVSDADRRLYSRAWDEASEQHGRRLRVLDRRRNRGAWFARLDTPWQAPKEGPAAEGPPIVVFYSFKGGVGRTTALASFAIQRARLGERVVVLDADLDAPGLGTLLPNVDGGTAPWGIVDYLLERPQGEVDLRDYYHVSRSEAVTGAGEVFVFPAGRVEPQYLGKLARVDLEPPSAGPGPHPLERLLRDSSKELRPNWILVDARAGLADPAGMFLAGLAHLHVLFGTFSEQSWAGLRLVVERLGGDRVRAGLAQADCLVVQAMVPENVAVAEQTRREFEERARDEFVASFYAEDPEAASAEGDFWYVGDADSSDAPHVPIGLSYSSRLADFRSVELVADHLAESSEYRHLAARIGARFGAI